MIKFNKLDFQLCRIPEHMKMVYIYVINGETYLTFDFQHFKTVLKDSSEVQIKHLQKTNHLRVPFNSKKIVNTEKQLFKLENKK